MLNRKPSTRFLKDIKLTKKRGADLEKLEKIVTCLCENEDLPKQCRPHILFGEWNDCWECHIEPDWLLIYRFTQDEIHLIRTGTHSDLF
jgi:mRNA interferase YafQ